MNYFQCTTTKDEAHCTPCRRDLTQQAVDNIVPLATSHDCVIAEDALAEALRLVRLERMAASGRTFVRDNILIAAYFGDDQLAQLCAGRHAYLMQQDNKTIGVQLHCYRPLPSEALALFEARGYQVRTAAAEAIYNPGAALAIQITTAH